MMFIGTAPPPPRTPDHGDVHMMFMNMLCAQAESDGKAKMHALAAVAAILSEWVLKSVHSELEKNRYE